MVQLTHCPPCNHILPYLDCFEGGAKCLFDGVPTDNKNTLLYSLGTGGGPRVVVSTAAFDARVRGSYPGPGGL